MEKRLVLRISLEQFLTINFYFELRLKLLAQKINKATNV